MSQLDLSGFRKRKRGEKVFKFKVFGARGYPAGFTGSSFQENVTSLLEFGQIEGGACGAMATWSFQLEARRHPLLHLLLFVVEEPIELSLDFSCNHCRYIGRDQDRSIDLIHFYHSIYFDCVSHGYK